MDNQRVMLTKRILKDALIEELQLYSLPQISVKALCKKANLNRSTFYAHYGDIYDLFNTIEEDFLAHIVFFTSDMGKSEKLNRIIEFSLYVQKNRDTFFALVDNGYLLPKFINKAHEYNHAGKQNTSLLTAYTVTGTIALLYEWLKTPSIHSHEEIAKLILSLSNNAEKLI